MPEVDRSTVFFFNVQYNEKISYIKNLDNEILSQQPKNANLSIVVELILSFP